MTLTLAPNPYDPFFSSQQSSYKQLGKGTVACLGLKISLLFYCANTAYRNFAHLLDLNFQSLDQCSLVSDSNVYGSSNFLDQETKSEPIILDITDEEEEYPFVNKYPSFQEEPIVLVEEESCHIYDTDNEEEESMSVYDTDIEDVIEEEDRFVRKGGFGGEED
ncbi:hypothetical protein Tco_0026123 [Tanacetum coccineum]